MYMEHEHILFDDFSKPKPTFSKYGRAAIYDLKYDEYLYS